MVWSLTNIQKDSTFLFQYAARRANPKGEINQLWSQRQRKLPPSRSNSQNFYLPLTNQTAAGRWLIGQVSWPFDCCKLDEVYFRIDELATSLCAIRFKVTRPGLACFAEETIFTQFCKLIMPIIIYRIIHESCLPVKLLLFRIKGHDQW